MDSMSTNLPPAGWHPDPENPNGAVRWWDGTQWTSNVHPVSPTPAGGPPAAWNPGSGPGMPYGGYPPQGGPAWQGTNQGGWGGGMAPAGQASFARRNQMSLIAMAVALAYVLLDVTSHVYILGILPVVMSIRAFQRRESLAPAAVGAAIIDVVVALLVR